MKFPLGAMTAGDILDRGLKILFSRLPTFLAINLFFLLPELIWRLAFPPQSAVELFLLIPVDFVLTIFASAATLYVIEREFAARPVGVGSAIRVALSCFWRLLGAMLLFGLLLLLAGLGAIIPGVILMTVATALGPIVALPILLLVLFGVFAVLAWVMVLFCFFSQVVVVERSGAAEALVRSKNLGWGHGWRIFGVLFLTILLQTGANLLEGALGYVLPGMRVYIQQNEMGFITDLWIVMENYWYYAINVVVATLFTIVVWSYRSACLTLLYFDLRIRKEGYDLELAAQQEIPEALPLSFPDAAPPPPEEMPGTDRPW